jgi:hypothetical protein
MTKKEFNKLVKAHKLRGAHIKAVEGVLVGGSTAYAMAASHNVDQGLISRTIKKLTETPLCESCGQPVKEK